MAHEPKKNKRGVISTAAQDSLKFKVGDCDAVERLTHGAQSLRASPPLRLLASCVVVAWQFMACVAPTAVAAL